jgi:hypothetical protein
MPLLHTRHVRLRLLMSIVLKFLVNVDRCLDNDLAPWVTGAQYLQRKCSYINGLIMRNPESPRPTKTITRA